MKKKKLKLALACVKDPNADISFYLEQYQIDGSIRLRAICKNKTFKWSVLSINTRGMFERDTGIGEDTGFKVDKKGRIQKVRGK